MFIRGTQEYRGNERAAGQVKVKLKGVDGNLHAPGTPRQENQEIMWELCAPKARVGKMKEGTVLFM